MGEVQKPSRMRSRSNSTTALNNNSQAPNLPLPRGSSRNGSTSNMPDSKHSNFDTTTPRENNGSQNSGTASQKTGNTKKYFEEGTYAVLHEWWAENIENPYPDREERDRLCKATGLTHKQLVDWFANR